MNQELISTQEQTDDVLNLEQWCQTHPSYGSDPTWTTRVAAVINGGGRGSDGGSSKSREQWQQAKPANNDHAQQGHRPQILQQAIPFQTPVTHW